MLRRIVRHRGSPIGVPGNMLFRRDAFDAVGGFPDTTATPSTSGSRRAW